MAAEAGCVLHRQQRLSTSSVDKDEWNDFNGFETTQLVQSSIPDCVTGGCGLSENCANSCISTDSEKSAPLPSAAESSCLLHDAIERCFCRTSPEATNKSCAHTSSSVFSQSQDSLISNSRVWQTVINNVYNVLPTDWATTHARELLHSSLNISAANGIQPTTDLDLSEDEELQQAFDMHSLIVSNVHQEPLFTAEQVIKEIEDMLEDSSSTDETEPAHDDSYTAELAKLRERSHARIETARESIENMSSAALCELYDEMDSLVRELSEELVLELACRDELEYEKELKNQFISLLLSVQRRHRDLVDSKLRGGSSAGSSKAKDTPCTGSAQPGSYLTTLIPYDPRTVPPNIDYLQIYVKILTAINEDSPTVPALLTDYILNVICPKV